MRILVVYYSRTGTTKKVAYSIASTLKCNIDEIVDKKKRSGAIGYLMAGKDATLKRFTKIEKARRDPANYDLIIIGTPIWSWNLSPAVRTYINTHKGFIRNIALFCTEGGSGGPRAFSEIEAALGVKAVSTLELTTKEVVDNSYGDKLKGFINKLG